MLHLTRAHAIEIPLPVVEAFELFTPRGEMRWIAEWRPEFIHPADGETMEGMVFRTGAGADETLWSCIEWAPKAYRVRYARVTPASRFTHVSVECASAGPDATRVLVRYEMTALSQAGRAALEALTEAAFALMIEGWRTLILAHLAANEANRAGDP